jgi:ATP-binding cassette subfamily B protein
MHLWRSFREMVRNARAGAGEFITVAVPIFRPFLSAMRIVVILLFAEQIIDSIYPLLYGKLTDALVSKHGRFALIMLGVLVVQGLVSQLLRYIRERYEIERIDWSMNLNIMTESLERIAGFSMAQCAHMHTGKTRDIVRNGRIAMRQLVFMAIYRLGPTMMKLGLALIALTWMNMLVGSSAAIGTALYLGFAVVLFVRYRTPMKRLKDRDNENGKMFADTLANMEVVMANARQRLTVADFNTDGQEFVSQARAFWRKALGWFYIRNGAAFIWKYAVMGLTAWLLFRGNFSFGTFVALTQWAMMAVGATQELGQMQRELSEYWADTELYLQLLRKPPEIVSPPGAFRPESLRGAISFENVTFHYEPRASDDPLKVGEPVVALNDVTFTIPSGQKIALVGESGAGKSTVAYALMRARDPRTGTIRMDGTDLKSMDLDTVRRRIGYVSQHPRLFDRTLRYNLLFGLNDDDTASDDRLREILATVKLEHLADNGGLDRKLGENGHTLSGGERQRLCIARALIKDPDVLIFDEATSSLDPVNEKKVQDAIDAARGRTKLIIAHRYSTIRDVDRILVFDSGRLVDDGTHDELLSGSLYYRTLLEQQGLL